MGSRRVCRPGILLGWSLTLVAGLDTAAAARSASSFERWVAPVKLHAAEEQALAAVRQYARSHGLRFRLDRRLIRAARAAANRELTADAAAVDPEQVRALAQRWGWTDGQVAIISVPQFDLTTLTAVVRGQLERQLADTELNRVGIGAVASGERRRLVLLFSRRLVNLLPTPAQAEPGMLFRTSGWLPPTTAATTATLELVVLLPSGQTMRPAVDRHLRRFDAIVPLGPQPGVVRMQWLLDRGRGPEIAALFPVVVGNGDPTPAVGSLSIETNPSDDDPVTTLTALILGAREAEGESLPMTSAVLAELARRHAQDMRDHHFFAHVSPTTGDLNQRLHHRGLGFVRAVENLALADSAAGAFQQWMQSPAHRANLLDEQATALGVGMVADTSTTGTARWYAVAVLVRLADDGSDQELRQQATAIVNARRQALRLPRLRRDATLEDLATRHSRESAMLGELTDISPIRGRLVDTVLDETEASAAAADVILAGTVEAAAGAPHLAEPFHRVGVGVHRDRQRAGAQLWITIIVARD